MPRFAFLMIAAIGWQFCHGPALWSQIPVNRPHHQLSAAHAAPSGPEGSPWFSVTRSVHPAAAASSVPTLSGNVSSGQHHHHYRGTSSGWYVWGGSYPLLVSPYYTTPFPYYVTSYYSTPTILMPTPVVPQPAPVAPIPVNHVGNPAANPAPQPAPKIVAKVTNVEAKAKAGRFMAFGDANFVKQKYLPAAERYRTASEVAPDVADAYLRQGFALVAIGQYESAARAFRRALRIRQDWSGSGFRLDQIYGPDKIAKTAHLETLARAIETNPLDADLLLTLGIQLYFDGQRDRAELFLRRAAQLGGNDDGLLVDLLPKPAPADEKKPGAAKVVF